MTENQRITEPTADEAKAKAAADARAKAIAKIEKLLSLAGEADENGQRTDAEAQLAWNAAVKLMDKFRIESGEIGDATGVRANTVIGFYTIDMTNMDNCGASRKTAMHLFASAFGASTITSFIRNATHSGIYGHSMRIYAPESTIALFTVLLPSFMMQLESSLAASSADYRAHLKGEGRTGRDLENTYQSYRREFIVGFGQGAADKVAASRTETIDEAMGTGSGALVLASEHERSEAAMKAAHPNRRSGRSLTLGNLNGRVDGRLAGKRADIGQKQTTQGGDRPALG